MNAHTMTFREEVALRLFVDAVAQDSLAKPVDGAGTSAAAEELRRANAVPVAASHCIAMAQTFASAMCNARGEHRWELVRWLEGSGPSRPGQPGGAPRGIFACSCCGTEEERAAR